MKHFELFSLNTLIIILSAMLLGVVLGKFCPSNIALIAILNISAKMGV